ncbi:unnamed protein product [Brassica oleracea]|uniref:(rape) hypothetical protein n=1 Tax=Brassica napus TaxID=3708 RepID=A0A816UEL5_BRANA|nr:unnamed protein product [Brassica napus]
MFELWFREMEATTDPSSPAFLREVEAPSAPPTPVQVHGKGVFLRFTFAGLVTECGCFHRSALPMRNPKLLGQGYYCLFSAKLEVVVLGQGGGVLVLMMKLSAEVKSVKSTIRWFSMRASRVLSGSKAEMISLVGSLVVSGEISMV